MSTVDEWLRLLRHSEDLLAEAAEIRPRLTLAGRGTFSVDHIGKTEARLTFNQQMFLSAQEALELGRWILENF